VVRYKERLREFCHTTREQGVREIILVGESDLTFILEWCAQKEGLTFRQVGSVGEVGGLGEQEPSGSLEYKDNSGKSHPDRGAAGRVLTGGDHSESGKSAGGVEDPPARPGALVVLSEHTLETNRSDGVLGLP
jgi:hypothetical protein